MDVWRGVGCACCCWSPEHWRDLPVMFTSFRESSEGGSGVRLPHDYAHCLSPDFFIVCPQLTLLLHHRGGWWLWFCCSCALGWLLGLWLWGLCVSIDSLLKIMSEKGNFSGSSVYHKLNCQRLSICHCSNLPTRSCQDPLTKGALWLSPWIKIIFSIFSLVKHCFQ